jgi:hypothetical protein
MNVNILQLLMGVIPQSGIKINVSSLESKYYIPTSQSEVYPALLDPFPKGKSLGIFVNKIRVNRLKGGIYYRCSSFELI